MNNPLPHHRQTVQLHISNPHEEGKHHRRTSSPLLNLFNKLEKKTGIQRKYLCSAVILVVFLALVLKVAESAITNIFGFLYPAYCSIKAIESKETDDDTRFLMYWVVYGTFSVLEIFADVLLFWVPFYYLLKCGFLLWCMHPSSRGTDWIYARVAKSALDTAVFPASAV